MNLNQLQKEYHELFYVEDKALFPLLIAITIGAKLNAPPVWIYIIGPSSGGKSTVMSVLNKVPFITALSDLTTNTFLSGAKATGKETSLLKKLGNNFVITMKDFTTMISKDDASKGPIIAQMREIYDGHIVKATGNGDYIEWGSKEKPNKGTFIMAATEGIYKIQSEFADMGTRAINYVFVPQDRKKTARAALTNKRNHNKSADKLGEIQKHVAEFILDKILNAPEEFPLIDKELEEEIIDVADLASMCRSVVDRDYKGEVNLALSAEFPMRMAEQLLAIAQFMTYANDGVLTNDMKNTIYKTAFDSIPKQRRIVLEVLASYQMIDVIAAGMKINYPSELVRKWVEDLHMFGIVDRERVKGKEFWKIRDEYRQTLIKYLGITIHNESLESDERGEIKRDGPTWEDKQQEIELQQAFDNDFK